MFVVWLVVVVLVVDGHDSGVAAVQRWHEKAERLVAVELAVVELAVVELVVVGMVVVGHVIDGHVGVGAAA